MHYCIQGYPLLVWTHPGYKSEEHSLESVYEIPVIDKAIHEIITLNMITIEKE